MEKRVEKGVVDDKAIEKHRDLLVQPEPEWTRAKAELFGLKLPSYERAPSLIIGGRRHKEVQIHVADGISPKGAGDIAQHRHQLRRPRTLEELRAMIGLDVAVENAREIEIDPKDEELVAKLPQRPRFEKLDPDVQRAAWNVAQVLLYERYQPAILQQVSKQRLVSLMLASHGRLKLIFSQNLVVANGSTVSFVGAGALWFGNVLVYGSGRIRTGNNTKLHAYSIRHE